MYKEIINGTYRWAIDNGQFTGNIPLQFFVNLMEKTGKYAGTCLFASCPDVVGDAEQTMKLFPEWRNTIRSLGFKAALVGQDGLEDIGLPDDFDAFFIGGTTKWKLGKHAKELARQSKNMGKWLHMGRVNTLSRIHYAMSIGCDSVDGTHIVFSPDVNARHLIAWMNTIPPEILSQDVNQESFFSQFGI